MRTYNCVCPICGHENRNLDLAETGGMMECERCKMVVHSDRCQTTVNVTMYESVALPIHRRCVGEKRRSGWSEFY